MPEICPQNHALEEHRLTLWHWRGSLCHLECHAKAPAGTFDSPPHRCVALRHSKYSKGFMKGCIPAVEVSAQFGLHFAFFFLALRPEGLAHRVGREIESLHLVNAVQVHTPLQKQVLTPRLHVRVFFAPLPVQGRHAVVKVCQESAESLVADDLKIPE